MTQIKFNTILGVSAASILICYFFYKKGRYDEFVATLNSGWYDKFLIDNPDPKAVKQLPKV